MKTAVFFWPGTRYNGVRSYERNGLMKKLRWSIISILVLIGMIIGGCGVPEEVEEDEMLHDYSKLLNRLSGLADEMSSYFRRMKEEKRD